MKRCAIYARYSSDLQSPTSIDDQTQLCRVYAERQGWTVVATFHDAALSGFGVEHRPGYQQLLAAALTTPPPFDIILVEDLSRLTRDTGELLRLFHRFRLKGIELAGVSDGIATGQPGAKVQLTIKGLVNELYLDDLRDKTHRGLSGRVHRGLSAGGRIFGYRTIPVREEPQAGKRLASARYEVDPHEAEIVRRIFRDYADGRSMRAVANQLNVERVAFPGQDRRQGAEGLGWAVSAIRVILQNEKYAGVWIWNKTRFLKDPDSGRRRGIARPPEEWIHQERPELRIVEPTLWEAVRARLAFVREAFGYRAGGTPRGRASRAYSPYLLSGILRCGACGARMVAQTFRREKGARVYRYSWYRCGTVARSASCHHRTGYRRETLEGAVIAQFRRAMTPAMIDALTVAVNRNLEVFQRRHGTRLEEVKTEMFRLEREAGHLVRFVAEGGESALVREELRAIEAALQGLRGEFVAIERRTQAAPLQVHRTWILEKLERLDALLRQDPARAKAEIVKHLDGELTITPKASPAGERRAEIRGRAKVNSLLAGEGDVVCSEVVAGARTHRYRSL